MSKRFAKNQKIDVEIRHGIPRKTEQERKASKIEPTAFKPDSQGVSERFWKKTIATNAVDNNKVTQVADKCKAYPSADSFFEAKRRSTGRPRPSVHR